MQPNQSRNIQLSKITLKDYSTEISPINIFEHQNMPTPDVGLRPGYNKIL